MRQLNAEVPAGEAAAEEELLVLAAATVAAVLVQVLAMTRS